MYVNVDTSNHSYKIICSHISSSYNYSFSDGEYIADHLTGAHFFTVGQRKGLAVGGTKEPLFVLKTDVVENIIYVGEGKEVIQVLFRKALFIKSEGFASASKRYVSEEGKYF